MTKSATAIVIFLLFVLAAATTWSVFRPTPQQQGITQWEYLILAVPDEQLMEELKRLGGEGWELAAARRALGGDSESNRKAAYELILKRPRPSNYFIH